MKKYSKLMAVLLVVAMLLPGIAQAAPVTEEVNGVNVTRLGGTDRIGTSVLASEAAYKDGADAVVLAGFGGDVDALTGTLLAANKKAPLLVTRQFELSDAVKTEIERLGAKTVYILGGETAVGEEVETALEAMTGITVERVEGANRNATAAEVAKEVKGTSADHVFLALGRMPVETDALADALAIGPVSAMEDMPVLLAETNRLPAETIAAMKDLGTTKVTIVGGKSAISQEVEDMLTDFTVDRVAGDSREKTALAIAAKYFAEPSNLIVAYGRKSADALVGGYLGAKWNAPILLTNHAGLTAETKAYIEDHVLDTYVLGGTTVVPQTAFDQIVEALKGEEVDELEIESVSAINAQTIEVTFNRAVVDTSKAEFELLRGTFKQNATVEWAEDNKSATLKVAGKLQDSKYTVNVSGLTDEVLSETITVEAQKVASIEILDDIAVLSGKIATGTDSNTATATVGYQVKDQYGDDITKTTTLETNDTKITLDRSKGVITIGKDLIQGKKVGDLIPVVLIDKDTGVTVTKSVKLSDASAVDTLEIESIYHKDDKELNEDSDGTEFFLVLNLQDQYGKEITKKELAENLIATSTNSKVVSIAKEGENLKVETKEIDGKDRLVLSFDKKVTAGTSKIILISTTNGATTEFEVSVAETTRTDAIDLGQPEIAVKGEKTLLPLTVQDKEGKIITDLKVLNNDVKGVKLSKGKVIVKDDQTFVELPKATEEGYETVVATTSTNKVATVTFEVKAEATAAVIRGLKKPLVVRANDSVTLDNTYFNIEDQYGRVMKSPDQAILVEATKDGDKVINVDANLTKVEGIANGKAKLVVSLANVEDSELEVQVQVTDGKEFVSYEIEKFDYKVEAGVATDFTVNGILEDGGKIALETGDYTAEIVNAKDEVVGSTSSGKVDVPATALDWKDSDKTGPTDDKKDTEFTLKVLVQATGKTLEEKFVVSDKTSVEQEIFFTTSVKGDKDVYKEAKEVTDVTVKNTHYTINTPVVVGDENTELNVATVDQYGKKEVVGIAADEVRIVPEDARKVSIKNNGETNAKATLVTGVNEAKLTVTVKIGNATEVLNVTLTRAESAIAGSYDVSKTPVISTMFDGIITLTGTATENVTVYAPNATVNNEATAPGYTITIGDVATGTWNEMVDGNTIIVNDTTGITLNIAAGKTVQSLTLNQPTVVNVADTATFTEPVVVKADSTIISKNPVKAKIAKDVVMTVKKEDTVDAPEDKTIGTDVDTEVEVGVLEIDSAKVTTTTQVKVTYNRALKDDELKAEDFTVMDGRNERAVSEVALEGKVATLTVDKMTAGKITVNGEEVTGDTRDLATKPENGQLTYNDRALNDITLENAEFLVAGLNQEGKDIQKPVSISEVKAWIEKAYGVTFNADKITIEDGTITITDDILSAADWLKVKANGNINMPYRITLLKNNADANEGGEYPNEKRAARIAIYSDGTVLEDGTGKTVTE